MMMTSVLRGGGFRASLRAGPFANASLRPVFSSAGLAPVCAVLSTRVTQQLGGGVGADAGKVKKGGANFVRLGSVGYSTHGSGAGAGSGRKSSFAAAVLFGGGALCGAICVGIFKGGEAAVVKVVEREAIKAYDDPTTRAQAVLDKCVVPELPEVDLVNYVSRKALERRLLDHVSRKKVTGYLVLVGPRGGGKTTVVKKVLHDRGMVVYVRLTIEFNTIEKCVRKKLGLPADGEPLELADVFKGVQSLSSPSKRPILVVEIDSNVSADKVRTQSQELKDLCSDRKFLQGFLVLSDANAALHLNPDPDRQDLIFVGDLSFDEMNLYLDKRHVLPTRGEATEASRAQRLRFFDEFGGRPMKLARAAAEVEEAAEEAVRELPEDATEADRVEAATEAERRALELCMKNMDAWAEAEVNNLLNNLSSDGELRDRRPELRKLMRALLEKPAGVPQAEVDLSASEVARQVKTGGFHALSFNSETHLFVFTSKAHERAARAWFERKTAQQKIEKIERSKDQRRLRMRWLGTGRFFM